MKMLFAENIGGGFARPRSDRRRRRRVGTEALEILDSYGKRLGQMALNVPILKAQREKALKSATGADARAMQEAIAKEDLAFKKAFDAQANLKLSQDRANSVVGELTALGVSADRLSAEGYGMEHPIADNSTAAGRAQNRRVAIRVVEK